MITTQDPHEWVDRDVRPRFPQLADSCVAAYEITRSAARTGCLESADLGIIEAFCRNPSSYLSEYAAELIGSLAVDFPAARQALVKLAGDQRVKARTGALVALHSCAAIEVREAVIRIALHDRSARVRELAACKAQRFRLLSLVEELQDAIAREVDASCKLGLEMNCALLKDGYFVEKLDAAAMRVTVAGKRSIVTREYSATELEQTPLAHLIEEQISSAIF